MLKLEISGNLGADAEIKDVSGSKFVAFRVAHTDKWTGEDQVKHEETTWVDCTMSNIDSKIIPYLKAGTKVFVRGNARQRVYSSPKLKKMVAGLQCSVTEIELVGGQADIVPRQLIVPEDGSLVDVSKHYWCNADTKGMKKDELKKLIDTKGRGYVMNKGGFVIPEASTTQEDPQDSQGETNENAQ